MDKQSQGRRVIRGRTGPSPRQPINKRRVRIATRRNRRLVPRRNRLERVQNNRNRIGRPTNRRFRRFNFNRRRNFNRRILFIGGLPSNITNRGLLNLFRAEGPIIGYRVMKNRSGYSRGFGFLEFVRPRDAWKSIQKWNNTTLGNKILKVQFKRRRNFNQRRFGNNNFNNRNNGGFNQRGRGFGFRGERGRGGFRQRGRY
jgi:RNA recognition motif-containing protein